MIKNYIDINKFKNEYKANIINSFMRRTFSIDNIKLLFMDAIEYYDSKHSDTPNINKGFKDYHEISYSIRVSYSAGDPNNKDEYRELLKDTFFYIHNSEKGAVEPDRLSLTVSKDYTVNNYISSNFLIEHVLYSFNKKLDNRNIRIDSIKKVYISLKLPNHL